MEDNTTMNDESDEQIEHEQMTNEVKHEKIYFLSIMIFFVVSNAYDL